jgi:hypothetical protein
MKCDIEKLSNIEQTNNATFFLKRKNSGNVDEIPKNDICMTEYG